LAREDEGAATLERERVPAPREKERAATCAQGKGRGTEGERCRVVGSAPSTRARGRRGEEDEGAGRRSNGVGREFYRGVFAKKPIGR
jgi:hypothetical protein